MSNFEGYHSNLQKEGRGNLSKIQNILYMKFEGLDKYKIFKLANISLTTCISKAKSLSKSQMQNSSKYDGTICTGDNCVKSQPHMPRTLFTLKVWAALSDIIEKLHHQLRCLHKTLAYDTQVMGVFRPSRDAITLAGYCIWCLHRLLASCLIKKPFTFI